MYKSKFLFKSTFKHSCNILLVYTVVILQYKERAKLKIKTWMRSEGG